MTQLQAICEALAFVEAHLQEDVTVGHMAEAAGYSLYHFTRTFNRLVHHTPYDYLVRRRLSESARELLDGGRRILDVALDYRFNNPETYTRAFKRMFEVQPSRWVAEGAPHRGRMMPPLRRDYLAHINRGGSPKPTRETLGPLRLVGLMTLVQGPEPATLTPLREALARELGDAEAPTYAVTWYPAGRAAPRALYLARPAGAEVTAGSPLVHKTLPALDCARFPHRGTRAALRWTRAYVRHTWLPQAGERRAHPMEIEVFDPVPGEPDEWALCVPLA